MHRKITYETVKGSNNHQPNTRFKKLYPNNRRFHTHVSSTRKEEIQRLGIRLGVKDLNDWRSDTKAVKQEKSFINNSSLYKELKEHSNNPHHYWNDLSSSTAPKGYWNNINNQRDALEKLVMQLGVKELDDWYTVDSRAVRSKLSFIFTHYHGSMYTALKKLYPQHEWNPVQFSHAPQGYWNDSNNQRDAFEKIGMQLGVKELDDWYSVNIKSVRNELSFINNYFDSLFSALKHLYPQHNWNPLKFRRVRDGYWSDINNQRDALHHIGLQLGVKELDEWYAIDARQVRKELSFIHTCYHGSIFKTLKTLYPQHNWNALQFSRVPKGYWNHVTNQRDALEKLGKQIGIKDLNAWYFVDNSKDEIKEVTLIQKYYHGALDAALKELYPQHWNLMKLSKVPQTYWQQSSTISYCHTLFTKWKLWHNIQTLEDWYLLPTQQLKLLECAATAIFGSVTQMVQEWFPEINGSGDAHRSTTELKLHMMLRTMVKDIKVS